MSIASLIWGILNVKQGIETLDDDQLMDSVATDVSVLTGSIKSQAKDFNVLSTKRKIVNHKFQIQVLVYVFYNDDNNLSSHEELKIKDFLNSIPVKLSENDIKEIEQHLTKPPSLKKLIKYIRKNDLVQKEINGALNTVSSISNHDEVSKKIINQLESSFLEEISNDKW